MVGTSWVKSLTGAGYSVIAYDNAGTTEREAYNLEDTARRSWRRMRAACSTIWHRAPRTRRYSMGTHLTFLAIAHHERVRRLVFGGSDQQVRAFADRTGGKRARSESIDADEPDGSFRASPSKQKRSQGLAAASVGRATIPRGAWRAACPCWSAWGKDVIGGSAAASELLPGARGIELDGRDH